MDSYASSESFSSHRHDAGSGRHRTSRSVDQDRVDHNNTGDASHDDSHRRQSHPGGDGEKISSTPRSSSRSRSKTKRRSKSRRRGSRRSPSSSSSASSSSSSRSRSRSRRRKRKRKSKDKKRSKKRHHRRSRERSDSPSASSSVSSDGDGSKRRPHNRKSGHHNESDNSKDNSKKTVNLAPNENPSTNNTATKNETAPNASSSKGPMTQSQYLQLQNQIREVVDPHTGRTRWMRGTGEIIERIVSREEHSRLNQAATRGDGSGYAKDVMRAAIMRK